MTTIENENGRPRLELVGPVDDDQAAELVQPAPAGSEAEQLDQTPAGESAGKELVPVEPTTAELVEQRPAAPLVPVEARPVKGPRSPVEPRPVLPSWLRDGNTFRAAVAWAAGRTAHLAAFHGLRLPLYWLKLVGRSPIGVGRTLAGWSSWVSDSPGRAVRENLAKGPGITPDSFYRVTEQHRDQVRGRLGVTLATAVTLLAGMWGFVAVAPGWATGAAILLGFVLFGMLGRSPDAPIVARSTDSDSVPRLTADLILTALASIGIGELNKAVRGRVPAAADPAARHAARCVLVVAVRGSADRDRPADPRSLVAGGHTKGLCAPGAEGLS